MSGGHHSVRTGGQLIVDALLAQGVERVFGVPGESYLPILDALHDVQGRLSFVTCRHEHGAAMRAEAYGKLDGRPGVCLVTRGPGACNAAIVAVRTRSTRRRSLFHRRCEQQVQRR